MLWPSSSPVILGLLSCRTKRAQRLKFGTSIDIPHEVKCGLVTLHMQDHRLIMHASRLDKREQVWGIARSRDCACSVLPIQIGSERQIGKGNGELMQAENEAKQ